MEKKRRLRSNDDAKAAASASDSDWFSAEELEAAREAYLEAQELEHPSPEVKLRYAMALVKSKKRDDKIRGMGLLEDLLREEFQTTECLYWLALTTFGLGDFRTSRSYCEQLLRIDPSHTRAHTLHQCIKERTANGDMVGIGVMGVAVVVAGLALRMMLKR